MKKNLEWLKQEINDNGISALDLDDNELVIELDMINEFLDQLDEPEVLSQEWIDNHTYHEDEYDFYYADPDELKNLLVPKREEITEEQAWEVLSELYDIPNKSYIREAMRVVADSVEDESTLGELKEQLAKPVIPNFVAEWISKHHERFDLYPALKRLENNALSWEDVYEWYRKNTRKFVNAYLTGRYEVAEEQKYRVILEENSYGAMGLGIGREGRLTFTATHDKWSLPKLTEQEIKDYDERFWPFAVKVEELEE